MTLSICANGKIDEPFTKMELEYVSERLENEVLGENLRKLNVQTGGKKKVFLWMVVYE